MGLKRLELLTPALSEQCSNQLSYRPDDSSMNKRSCLNTNLQSASQRKPTYFVLQILDVCDRYLWSIIVYVLALPNTILQKGGDPAAPSDTATLLRLSPNQRPYLRRRSPCG
jgi:hypothetical protein